MPAAWSTERLTGLLDAVAGLPDQQTVVRTAVEHVARALRSDRTVLVVDGQVAWSRAGDGCVVQVPPGSPQDLPPTALREPVEALPDAALVVTRDEPFTNAERVLLGGMVRVLSLAVQARRLLDTERAQVHDTALLLASLRERQVLLERLSRIQRSISSRQPLAEVLDAIVAGAADLLHEDIVGLRLLDPQDDGFMLLASSIGVPEHLAASTLRQPVGQGIGGRAIVENALVHTSDYAAVGTPLPGFADDGILSAMAAPVRQGSRAVGSLVVATRRPDRAYSASEQEALTAFAEHVSLALNDAASVAALHQAVADATHQSRHDSLTGLPNRTLFLEELQRASAGDFFTGDQPLAVLFVDIDDFKVVNDSLGHPVGDQLLTAVARRVVDGVRSPDVVARLGGDEFAVLMQRTREDEALRVAERVLEALQLPFELDGHALHVGASIGLVSSGSGWAQPEELLRDADVAMYRAKAEGKHRCVVFAPGMRDELQARTVLETELRQAVAREQLTLHFQPVVDARTGRVASTEALLRWEHPRLGLVPPGDFVPLAEDTGLIVAIGAVVLRAACEQTVAWRRAPELAHLTVSVNVSPRQLHEDGLVDLVRDVLAETGLPAGALVLELTESMLVDDAAAATRLHELKALGIKLAVDDFGTGWSSLSYLARLPVDVLKVDRSFVAGIGAGPAGKLAWAVLALAASLGLDTVAEGVETAEQAAALVEQGCTTLQGYLFSPPVPAPLLPALVRRIEDARAGAQPDSSESLTSRTSLSTLRSTRAIDCQVPRPSTPPRTGTDA